MSWNKNNKSETNIPDTNIPDTNIPSVDSYSSESSDSSNLSDLSDLSNKLETPITSKYPEDIALSIKIKNKDTYHKFWKKHVWKINIKYIYHSKIQEIFNKFKNFYNKEDTDNTRFNFDENFQVLMINDKKEIKKKIKKFKKDNLNFLKTHAECIREFHFIQFNYLKKKITNISKDFKKDFTQNLFIEPSINSKPNQVTENNTIIIHQEIQTNISNQNYMEQKDINDSEKKYNYGIFKNCLDNFESNIENYSGMEQIKFNKHKINIMDMLEKNLKPIRDELLNFINLLIRLQSSDSIPNKKILILDTENIFKSFKIQDFLKNKTNSASDKYFNIWSNGYLFDSNLIDSSNNNNDYSNISLSEYSSKIKYIEPFTSLNICKKNKITLSSILIDELLSDYYTISIITCSNKIINLDNQDNQDNNQDDNLNNHDDNNLSQTDLSNLVVGTKINKNIFVYKKKHLVISVKYDKNDDIREQDDHILLFLYQLIKNYLGLDVSLLSNDKFKWFKNFDYFEIKNFKYLYDFDNFNKKIIIGNPYIPDLIIKNKSCNIIPNINFPILSQKSLENICSDNYGHINNIICGQNNLGNKFTLDFICNLNFDLFFNFLMFFYTQDNQNQNQNLNDLIKLLLETLRFFIKYSIGIKKYMGQIFEYLESQSKKDIFKLSIEMNQKKFNDSDINQFILIIIQYTRLIELVQIIKIIGIKFFENDEKYIDSIVRILTVIHEIYDSIGQNIYKIRKLSSSKSGLRELFTKLNSTYVFIRKQGYLKKNIF